MTIGEYVPVAMGTFKPSVRKGWATYANRIVECWGDRPMVEGSVLPSEILAEANRVKEAALKRATSTNGQGAFEGFVACCRRIWKSAGADYGVSNPALAVKVPKRNKELGKRRRALSGEELRQVETAIIGSSDPELGLLVFRFFLETGARRSELLGVNFGDLGLMTNDVHLMRGTKNDSTRYQPVTPGLIWGLRQFVISRSGVEEPDDGTPVFLNRKKQRITHRYLEDLSVRVRKQVPVVGDKGDVFFTWHLLRHTTATYVERVGSFALAVKFLGHSLDSGSGSGYNVTLGYVKATHEELRRVIVALYAPDKNSVEYS